MSGQPQPHETSGAGCTGVPNAVSGGVQHGNDRKCKIRWRRIMVLGSLQLQALYGLYLIFTWPKMLTIISGEYGHEL